MNGRRSPVVIARVARGVGLVAPAVLLASCAHSGTTTWYGQVTTVHPRLCVGRHAALGDCFVGGPAAQIRTLRVGECVKVVFRPATDPQTESPHLTSITRAAGSKHRTDCPSAP